MFSSLVALVRELIINNTDRSIRFEDICQLYGLFSSSLHTFQRQLGSISHWGPMSTLMSFSIYTFLSLLLHRRRINFQHDLDFDGME